MMLISKTNIPVRFSEIDSLGILWHGHYIKYFEDGREAFGAEYNLGYMDVYAQGYALPVVRVECNYKNPIRYNDRVHVETTYINSPAAKVIFDYKLYNTDSGLLLATGRSEQVFLDLNNQLFLTIPPFFEAWKNQHGIITSS